MRADSEATLAACDAGGLAVDILPRGALAGEYEIVRWLGSGGCGAVYEAEHRILGRRAALKVLHAGLARSPRMIERFVREARSVNRIRHPNIVDIYDVGRLADGRPFFVMELLRGQSLEQLLAVRGRLRPAEAWEILEPVCRALEAAHAVGVIHRDLKAANIGLHDAGNGSFWVKLLDFGIAKVLDEQHPMSTVGLLLGTPHVMAPEQFTGEPVDARTDVYAVGVLAFQMICGRYPFVAGSATELGDLHLTASPPRPSDLAPIPPALDAVILRALAKRKEARFAGIKELAEAWRTIFP